jgi:hypothetical protein
MLPIFSVLAITITSRVASDQPRSIAAAQTATSPDTSTIKGHVVRAERRAGARCGAHMRALGPRRLRSPAIWIARQSAPFGVMHIPWSSVRVFNSGGSSHDTLRLCYYLRSTADLSAASGNRLRRSCARRHRSDFGTVIDMSLMARAIFSIGRA